MPLAHRRTWLRAAAALGVAAVARPGGAHDRLGPVAPPRAAPALPLVLHDGRQTHLPALLQGRVTALQLMFTGCSATCPVMGAVFAELQGLPPVSMPVATSVASRSASRPATAPAFPERPQPQLLSLSIDPLSDDAAALAGWRRRHGAGSAWVAAAPPLKHADALPLFLGSRLGTGAGGTTNGDRHDAQVYLFDARGRLAYLCAEFASAKSIAQAMRALLTA